MGAEGELHHFKKKTGFHRSMICVQFHTKCNRFNI